jgi:hypothetical protein
LANLHRALRRQPPRFRRVSQHPRRRCERQDRSAGPEPLASPSRFADWVVPRQPNVHVIRSRRRSCSGAWLSAPASPAGRRLAAPPGHGLLRVPAGSTRWAASPPVHDPPRVDRCASLARCGTKVVDNRVFVDGLLPRAPASPRNRSRVAPDCRGVAKPWQPALPRITVVYSGARRVIPGIAVLGHAATRMPRSTKCKTRSAPNPSATGTWPHSLASATSPNGTCCDFSWIMLARHRCSACRRSDSNAHGSRSSMGPASPMQPRSQDSARA